MQTSNKQRLFAFCGIVAPILFTLLVVVASLLRPGYSQTHNFVSDLGVGPYAIIQNANFIIFGLLSIGFAFGLRDGLPAPHGRALKAGVWLVIIFGFGTVFAGVFPKNYLSGGLHNLASSAAFLSIIAAQLLIWRGLKSEDNAVWGRYRTYSLISGLVSLILLPFSFSTDFPGATQRIFIVVLWIWIEVTGLKLYSLTKTPPRA
jgi:hypothetical membrane protein